MSGVLAGRLVCWISSETAQSSIVFVQSVDSGPGSEILVDVFHIWLFWVNYNDLTVLPHWNHDLKGKSSPNGRKIQVSEIL